MCWKPLPLSVYDDVHFFWLYARPVSIEDLAHYLKKKTLPYL